MNISNENDDPRDKRIAELENELALMAEELEKTKLHLKRYTAPERNRKFYENNTELIKEKNRVYKELNNYKSTPEQRKIVNRRAYLKRKERLLNEKAAKSD